MAKNRICTVDSCEKPYEGSGLCHMHSERRRRTGSVGPAEQLRFYVVHDSNATQKQCSKCQETKPLSGFFQKKGVRDGRSNVCKTCWPNYDYSDHAKRVYGITAKEYDDLLQKQNGKCAICHLESKRRLAVDHDHTTGAIRGLLCVTCNTGLGSLYDDPVILLNAMEYLSHGIVG